MSSFTANICILVLVLLSLHCCHSLPHRLNKREIIKDYFNPAVVSPLEFEKGEDGKYYLKKNSHKSGSVVNYVEDQNSDDKSEETIADKSIDAKTANPELLNMKSEPVTETAVKNAPFTSSFEGMEKESVEEKRLDKVEMMNKEASDKVKTAQDRAPYSPVDPKALVPSKPNSKDEIAQTVLPQTIKEEKVDEKVAIGEVPHFDPKLISIPNNFRLPIFIPVRQLSFGSVSVLPLLPSQVSDRLPMPYDDEIIGEDGPEGASLEESSEEKEEHGLPLGDPYVPAIPFTGTFLKDLKEAAAKQDVEKQTRVVDVLGKKFVMQSNVVKYPRGDLGHTFVRFMSVKPLEAVDPKPSEEGSAIEGKLKDALAKDISAKEKEISTGVQLPEVKKTALETDIAKKELEKETLKAEETRVKMKTQSSIPTETAESGFKKYEDPYVKGIEEMINKNRKYSFEETGPFDKTKEVDEKISSAESEEKMKREESAEDKSREKIIFEGNVEKQINGADFLVKETKNGMEISSLGSTPILGIKKKEVKVEEGSEKAKKKTAKKKKCKCEDSDSDDE